ncbi:Syntaxin 1A [Carabus blaptoides fortunei]
MSPGTKDRLKELAEAQNIDSKSTSVDIKDGEIPPQLQEVFQKVYTIRNLVGNIRENTKKTKELVQNNSISAKPIYDDIEVRMKDTVNIAFKITSELKDFDVKGPSGKNDSDKSMVARVKRIQYASLRQEFQNALFESNAFLENYREQRRTLLKKQAALVNASLEDEELEKLLDDPDSIQMFTDNILLDTRIAREQLTQIEERHAELMKIEDMVVEVNSMFKRIAILVEQQQEHIDRVEFHACDAMDYVDKGIIDIRNAEKNSRRVKKKVYIAVFCAVLLVIILLLIFYK